MSRFGTILILTLLLWSLAIAVASAEEETEPEGEGYVEELSEQLDFTEVESVLVETKSAEALSFSDYFKAILLGEETLTAKGIATLLLNFALRGFQTDASLFARLFFLVLVGTLFQMLADTFASGQAAKVAGMVTFCMLAAILLQCFLTAYALAYETICFLLRFSSALLPVYLTGILFCHGTTTAAGYYQVYLAVITIGQSIVLSVLMPLCNLYLLFSVSGQLPIENGFAGFANLTRRILKWGQRAFVVIATGFSMLQSLLAPGMDLLKRNTVTKSLGMIPGFGSVFSGVTETVLSAGAVVKNAIGVTGVLVLVLVCISPLMKLLVYLWLFRFTEAAAGMIAGKHLVGLIASTAEAISLLLSLVAACMLSFVMILVIMTAGGQ